MKKHIPNVLTCLNAFCGAIAVTQIAEGQFVNASLLILLAAFFDFFDGMVARLLKVSSELGTQLDSLSDVISFGLAPAYLAVSWISYQHFLLYFIPLIMVPFSVFRLAKFNLDDRQTNGFIGLPTPANALFWLSLPLIQWQINESSSSFIVEQFFTLLNQKEVLIIISLVMSLLLIAELPLLALKFKSLNLRENIWRYILIACSVVIFIFFGFGAIPIILILYLLISVLKTISSKRNEIQS